MSLSSRLNPHALMPAPIIPPPAPPIPAVAVNPRLTLSFRIKKSLIIWSGATAFFATINWLFVAKSFKEFIWLQQKIVQPQTLCLLFCSIGDLHQVIDYPRDIEQRVIDVIMGIGLHVILGIILEFT